ncbi:unnamed protein product, partial [Scytosiphon promiscuus]
MYKSDGISVDGDVPQRHRPSRSSYGHHRGHAGKGNQVGHHTFRQVVRRNDVYTLPRAVDPSVAVRLALIGGMGLPLTRSFLTVYQPNEVEGRSTSPATLDFPDDLFYRGQRVRGSALQHQQRPDTQGIWR